MNECPIAATVPDANRQQLAYVYYENEPGRRSAAKLLTKDEARRIATQRQAPRAIKSPSDVGSALRVRARSRTMRFLTIQVPSQPNACSQHCKDYDQRVHSIYRHPRPPQCLILARAAGATSGPGVLLSIPSSPANDDQKKRPKLIRAWGPHNSDAYLARATEGV